MECTINSDQMSVGLTSLGGTLTSIKDVSGLEYLWQPDPDVWSGQAPIVFPICGGLRNDRAVTREGYPIRLKRHGFARKMQFELADSREDSTSFVLRSDESTLAQYPFKFELAAEYQVHARVLDVTYRVTNADVKPMPFFVGGHPAFRCPLCDEDAYGDYTIEFERNETDVCTPVPSTGLIDVAHRNVAPQEDKVLHLSHQLFDYAETIYDCLASRRVTFSRGGKAPGLQVSFPQMPYLIVWSKPNADFVAIEPWSGLSTCSDEDDIFEHKRGCLVCNPGETIERGFSIELLQ